MGNYFNQLYQLKDKRFVNKGFLKTNFRIDKHPKELTEALKVSISATENFREEIVTLYCLIDTASMHNFKNNFASMPSYQ